jgi:hypothetical protein
MAAARGKTGGLSLPGLEPSGRRFRAKRAPVATRAGAGRERSGPSPRAARGSARPRRLSQFSDAVDRSRGQARLTLAGPDPCRSRITTSNNFSRTRNLMRSPNGGLALRAAATVPHAPFAITILYHPSRLHGTPGFTQQSPRAPCSPACPGHPLAALPSFILFRAGGPVCPVANSSASARVSAHAFHPS